MGSDKEKKLKQRIEKLKKKASFPDRLYKLFTLIGVPSLVVLIGILFSQSEDLDEKTLNVKEERIVLLEEKIKDLEKRQSIVLTQRIITIEQNYESIVSKLEFKNNELRKILFKNKIDYDSLKLAYGVDDLFDDVNPDYNKPILPWEFDTREVALLYSEERKNYISSKINGFIGLTRSNSDPEFNGFKKYLYSLIPTSEYSNISSIEKHDNNIQFSINSIEGFKSTISNFYIEQQVIDYCNNPNNSILNNKDFLNPFESPFFYEKSVLERSEKWDSLERYYDEYKDLIDLYFIYNKYFYGLRIGDSLKLD
ncbi:hypothetical protein GCM10011344_33650 [Dokdonia pacifica]|uniref:Uncharacterized protein n=1 Tax=Dokdonia pacifica TaxID=1627892 RepID=A0A239BEW3_9FLAO|nr:hypothetical protein [Dokdonia pacifica]GGG30030.1 hypothetical protein GCM10011344_33650 [Dokdonia pacifica]SNS05888.1 hypothetical protein SAMN06265376_10691 [Dokdonia pacifica]